MARSKRAGVRPWSTLEDLWGTTPPAVDRMGTFALDFSAWFASGADPNRVAGAQVHVQV